VLRKYQGLLSDYYGYVTNLLRLCYGIAGSDTWSSHGYTTVLTGHNRSISVVYPVRSVVHRDQFQTTDQIEICYGYAAIASRLSTVSYGHLRSTTEEMKFLNMLKIVPRKKQNGGTSRKITVMSKDPGWISHR